MTQEVHLSFDLNSASQHSLESMADLNSVLKAVLALERESSGWLRRETLDKMYGAYMVRAVRLIGQPSQFVQEIHDFLAFLSRLTAKATAVRPPRTVAPVYAKFLELQAMLEVAAAQKVAEVDARTRSKSITSQYWQSIGDFILREKSKGRSQSEIAVYLREIRNGRELSKGAVSLVLSGMRSAGWIETTLKGNQNVHFPGPVLLQQSAGKYQLQQTGSPEINYQENLNLLVRNVCYNQAKVLEFNSRSGMLHKDLRTSISQFFDKAKKEKLTINSSQSIDVIRKKSFDLDVAGRMTAEVEEIVKCGKSLTTYISEEMHHICEKNFRYLQRYFKLRGAKVSPRISLKGFWPKPGENSSKRLVTTLYSTSTKPRRPSALDESSTFSRVYESGRYLLVNDVPLETFKGNYSSSRFNIAQVEKYRKNPDLYPFEQCFSDFETAPKSKLYRSSLVVPISLMLNQDLSKEFRDSWKKMCAKTTNSSGKEGLEGRLIFGFLCIDHVDPNFFKVPAIDPADISVAYFFADLLSFYLFQRASLTVGSEQFRMARAILGDSESRLRVDAPTQNEDITFLNEDSNVLNVPFVENQKNTKSNIVLADQINTFL